ncbi:MAG TPA: tetratricopeptide repeat protein [Gemmatimonadaceae bacterium]|nr:tetratricopeptide repeat protein [Gemmatimonadaceae bacterium]
MFVLRLFGQLALDSGRGALPPSALQRRRLTFLALLGLAGDRGLSRERIQAYLWPESPASRARHAMDQLLYATRRDLGQDAILSGAGDLRLNPAVISCDVQQFDAMIAAERWDEAVALYTGPVLDGQHPTDCAECERWLERERDGREMARRRALESLALAAAGRGACAEAAAWWRQRAGAEPLSAPVAIALMRALVAAGDRSGAVQHAHVHRLLVRQMLDLEADPAVEAFVVALSLPDGDRATRTESSPRGSNRSSWPEQVAPAGPREPAEAAPVVVTDRSARRAPWWPTRQESRLAAVGALSLMLVLAMATLLMSARSHPAGSGTMSALPRRSRAAGAGDRVALAARQTSDVEAGRLYLRAHALWDRRTRDGLEQAVVLYRRAAERDPAFASAYAGLAQAYAMLGYFGFGPADAMFPKARAAAQRALALDSASGDAHAALGQVRSWEHDWSGARDSYRTALALSPDDATVHQWYALMLAYVGRARESVVHTGIASRLDPLSVQINNFHGVMLYYSGDLDGALRQFERTVIAEPDSAWVRRNPWVLSNYGSIAGAAGRHARAATLIERALQVEPSHPRPLLDLARVYVRMGDTAQARAVFQRADTSHPHYLLYRALLHATLGEMDDAFQWMGRVREWPLAPLVGLNNDPAYAALRADPRFSVIRRSLALEE